MAASFFVDNFTCGIPGLANDIIKEMHLRPVMMDINPLKGLGSKVRAVGRYFVSLFNSSDHLWFKDENVFFFVVCTI